MKLKHLMIAAAIALLASCGEDANERQNVSITIDWIPSPEYYGFFYAKENGLYEEAGLEVTINSGSGAPVVASQLAINSIYVGTTTSDNVLKQIGRGAEFSRAVPLLKFNPASLIWISDNDYSDLKNLDDKTIGVNKQSSVYTQFDILLEKNSITRTSFKEFPIGWGGPQQLTIGDVDAFLGYTTNAAVDVALEHGDTKIREFSFGTGNFPIYTYGVVLVVASNEALLKAGIDSKTMDRFVAATLAGYERGANDIDGAANALIKAEPTLKKQKLSAAIEKIKKLNSSTSYPTEQLDDWVTGSGIDAESRAVTKELFKQPVPSTYNQ